MKAVWLAARLVTLGAVIVTLHNVLLVFFAAAVFAVPLRGATIALIVTIGLIAGIAAAVVWAWEVLLAGQMAQLVVTLPPALTIAAQLVLGLASGVIGIMMAAPFVAVAIVLMKRLVVEGVIELSRLECASLNLEEPVTGIKR